MTREILVWPSCGWHGWHLPWAAWHAEGVYAMPPSLLGAGYVWLYSLEAQGDAAAREHMAKVASGEVADPRMLARVNLDELPRGPGGRPDWGRALRAVKAAHAARRRRPPGVVAFARPSGGPPAQAFDAREDVWSFFCDRQGSGECVRRRGPTAGRRVAGEGDPEAGPAPRAPEFLALRSSRYPFEEFGVLGRFGTREDAEAAARSYRDAVAGFGQAQWCVVVAEAAAELTREG